MSVIYMSDLDYIGPNELVFNNDKENGVHSGGFSVNSIMMKAGMSPIMTLNMTGGSGDKVSDLFNDLVVPNWTLSYNNRIMSGGGMGSKNNNKNYKRNNDEDSDDDIVSDDLHDRLLDLVKETNLNPKKRMTKRNNKLIKTNKKNKTKKHK